ncbi:MAG: MBL fold metallo-hydrolase [Solirubrobacteraceae bacterium]
MSPPDPLAAHDIALVRANNPGPFTLSGSNTWIVGRDPCWVIDPGPDLEEHLAAVAGEAGRRGGAGAILLTHDHGDHADATPALALRLGVPTAAARWPAATTLLADGDTVGPLTAMATPGHAPDHLAFVYGRVCFTGDAVLGEGSVFVAPDPGALRGYLAALERLRALELELLCPGHGPVVEDPAAKLEHYISHRLDREWKLVEALEEGLRSVEDVLDRVWSDVPEQLRPAAAVTLAAHLDKLDEEDRLPDGVERPAGF